MDVTHRVNIEKNIKTLFDLLIITAMQERQKVRDAQELFEGLQRSSAHHDNSTFADRNLKQKLESASHRRSSDSIDVDEEITKLFSFFVIQSQQKITLFVIRR